MYKLIMAFTLGFLISAQAEIKNLQILTPHEVTIVEDGILKEALAQKNYDDVTAIAIAMFTTSNDTNYIGHREPLKNRAYQLLKEAAYNKNMSAGMFYVLNKYAENPLEAHEVSKHIIKEFSNEPEYKKLKKSFVVTHASITLDMYSTNVEECNFAIDSLHGLQMDIPQVNLYLAFLLKSIESHDMADVYVEKACNNARNPKIVAFCNTIEVQ